MTRDEQRAYEDRLAGWMREHAIDAAHLRFETSCHSVAEAATAAGVTAQDFIKTICMCTAAGEIVAVIVKGEDRADRALARAATGLTKLSIASPALMLERTGYPAGGTPPFGFDARFLIDRRVFEMPVLYGGGGSEYALVRISPAEMLRANGATVTDVRVAL
jgi:Cys-tRNA(Pro)/Cys-tRNA(Cys) deacylase